jgi:hypothetical protein
VAPRKANGEPTPTAFADTEARWCVSFASRSHFISLCPGNSFLRVEQPADHSEEYSFPIRIPQTGLPFLL